MSTTRLSRSMPTDLRAMLGEAKIGQFVMPMAIQYMNFLPETCDLYAQGVITIIQGLQNLLNDRGAHLEANGDFTVETMGALEHFAGPNWHSKSWAQLYGDVIAGTPYGGKFRTSRGTMLAGYDGVGHTAYHQTDGFVDDSSRLIGTAAMAACVYHGYRRNKTVGGAVVWGLAGAFFPIPAVAIAIAMGFAKPKAAK